MQLTQEQFELETSKIEKITNQITDTYVSLPNNEWLAHHPKEALIFSQTEELWKELENTYTDEFGNLVHGILPAGTDVLDSLKLVSERIKNITWGIDSIQK